MSSFSKYARARARKGNTRAGGGEANRKLKTTKEVELWPYVWYDKL